MVRMQSRKRNEGPRHPHPHIVHLIDRRRPCTLLLDISPQHRPSHRRHRFISAHDPPTIHQKHHEHSPLTAPRYETHQHRPRPLSTSHPAQRKTHHLPICLLAQFITSRHIYQRQSVRKSVEGPTGDVHGTEPFCTESRSWGRET